ncbi:MAG: prolipoprotein diacylglyceryl transferase [Oscillospiraceae bacterium]|jgi:phosphatidylglycerol:prolipoprotein diacylglycerol transferase|nr:prolipoprotein diacylglyceryl transferase [Oscillospiraceae bacterium]
MLNFFSRPPLDRVAFWGISWYGILIVAGILAALYISGREEKRLALPEDTAMDLALWGIPLGVVGARLYSVLFRLDQYMEDFWGIFNLKEGGLAIYGAILGGLLAAHIVARRKRVRLASVLDMVAPGLVLAQAIGRWGNYINMEAYGLRVSDAALQFFPFAVEIPVGQTWYWQLATFFYESVWDVLVFAALLAMRRRLKRPGDTFCWYALFYGVGRTVIEGLRDDSLTVFNEFVRVSQILSALACVAVVCFFCFRRYRRLTPPILLTLGATLLALITSMVGEFERGAYADLFTLSQWLLGILLTLNVVLGALRLRGRFPIWLKALPFALALAQLAVLAVGFGRLYDNNTLYVSVRQFACMAQMPVCAALLYFAPAPVRAPRHAQA